MKALHMVTFILVIVGGVNWGLVGAGDWNLVEMLLGKWPMVVQIVYILVGLSAIYLVATHMKDCKTCESKGAPAM